MWNLWTLSNVRSNLSGVFGIKWERLQMFFFWSFDFGEKVSSPMWFFFLINDFKKMKFSLFIWDGVHIHRIKWRRWNVLRLFYWRPHMLIMFSPFIVIILCVCLYVLLDHINPNNFMACKIFRKNQNFSSNHIKIWNVFYLKSHKL